MRELKQKLLILAWFQARSTSLSGGPLVITTVLVELYPSRNFIVSKILGKPQPNNFSKNKS